LNNDVKGCSWKRYLDWRRPR